jgi:cystathionine gamma-synthase
VAEAAPDKHDPLTVREATWAVHGGNAPDLGTGAVRRPLVMANSYLLPEDPTGVDWSNPETLLFTRTAGSNQQALETKVAALEGAEAAIAMASGVAAV